MRYIRLFLLPILLSAVVVSVAGCATTFRPTTTVNQPPSRALQTFATVELRPLVIPEDVQKREPTVSVNLAQKIESQLSMTLSALEQSRTQPGTGTVVLTPEIEQFKFISTGERLLGGALLGGSAALLRLRVEDKNTGELITYPEFYQHANAHASAYSYGSADRAMLDRVVSLMNDYVQNNFQSAVGGPTGKPE